MTSSGPNDSIGETESALLLASEGLLSRDNIPDENQNINCFACGENMVGLFCHACGQKNDDYRRSIFSLVAETFSSILSIENKMWRTWAIMILKPGKVPREFADGKRSKWTSPVRMYLALSIMLFGYMSLTQTRIFSIRTDIVSKSGFEGPVKNLNDHSVRLDPDFGFFRRQAELDELNKGTDFQRVARLIEGISHQAFIFDGNLSVLNIEPTTKLLKSTGSWPERTDNFDEGDERDEQLEAEKNEAIKIYTGKIQSAIDDYNELLAITMDPKTIADRIVTNKINNTKIDLEEELSLSKNKKIRLSSSKTVSSIDKRLNELGLSRDQLHDLPIETRKGFNIDIGEGQINGIRLSTEDIQDLTNRILRNPGLLNAGVSKYLPRIMFLMMPFAALIGLLFIRDRKRALLYDHLVHATYIHAVTFALLLVLILMSQWTPLGGMSNIFILGIAIYLPLSAKAMFKRGWFKTIFASFSIATLYCLVMIIVITLLTSQSMMSALRAGQNLS